MPNAIILKNISKKYSLSQERPVLLKNLFIPQKKEEVWALKNVNLNIKKGEIIGIIGENGSGKSTLLKIIAGITTPTDGSVKVNGRVGSLVELGAGFHPDLTGRENVYLNGTLLGFTKKELDKKYDEIVEFADIGEYINQPIRTYSSGMTVRLGFSVAIHLDPDILLIDEVLAVGDEEFQRKCIEVINDSKRLSRTIIFVTHNPNFLLSLCSKSLWIHDGKIRMLDKARLVFEGYLDYTENKKDQIPSHGLRKRWGTGGVRIEKINIFDKNNKKRFVFQSGDQLIFRIKMKFYKDIENPVFGFHLYDKNRNAISVTNTLWRNLKLGNFEKNTIIELSIKQNISFLRGVYFFTFAVASENTTEFYDWVENAAYFKVKGDMKSEGVELNPVFSIVKQ